MEKDVQLEEQQETKKYNKFQWFLFVILIPSLFAIALTLIILTFVGINVFEKAKEYSDKVPFLSSLIGKEEPKTLESLEERTIELKAQIKEREAKIDQLQKQLDGKDQEIERAKLEKERLQLEIQELTVQQNEKKNEMKEITQTYETMSPKKSAPIITEMNTKEAMKILTSLKPDTVAAILEKMDPKDAAKFTELLANSMGTTGQQ